MLWKKQLVREAWKNLCKTPLVETIFGNIFGFYRNTFVNSCLLFNLTFLRENNKILSYGYRGCPCNNRKPSFLPCLAFNWRIFSRGVTARWPRGWAKNQVSINQNSRNSWCLIVRRTICIGCPGMLRKRKKYRL